MTDYADLRVSTNDLVTTVEIARPPHNFFDYSLIKQIAPLADDQKLAGFVPTPVIAALREKMS